MSEAQLRDVRLYYEEHSAGAPIVCIHGTSSSALVWGDAVKALARLGRVIVYDRRGCTRSERPEPYERTSVAEHADDAAALLDALAATPAVVIGRSYGGEVAIDLTLRYPDRVRALVLLEAAALELSPDAAAWDYALCDRVRAVAREDGVDAVGRAFISEVLGETAWESFPAQLQQMFTHNGPAILAELGGESLTADRHALTTIAKPTLLVAASDSPKAFRQATDEIAAALPNARTALVGGGHLVNPAEPAVLAFIEEILAAAC